MNNLRLLTKRKKNQNRQMKNKLKNDHLDSGKAKNSIRLK